MSVGKAAAIDSPQEDLKSHVKAKLFEIAASFDKQAGAKQEPQLSNEHLTLMRVAIQIRNQEKDHHLCEAAPQHTIGEFRKQAYPDWDREDFVTLLGEVEAIKPREVGMQLRHHEARSNDLKIPDHVRSEVAQVLELFSTTKEQARPREAQLTAEQPAHPIRRRLTSLTERLGRILSRKNQEEAANDSPDVDEVAQTPEQLDRVDRKILEYIEFSRRQYSDKLDHTTQYLGVGGLDIANMRLVLAELKAEDEGISRRIEDIKKLDKEVPQHVASQVQTVLKRLESERTLEGVLNISEINSILSDLIVASEMTDEELEELKVKNRDFNELFGGWNAADFNLLLAELSLANSRLAQQIHRLSYSDRRSAHSKLIQG